MSIQTKPIYPTLNGANRPPEKSLSETVHRAAPSSGWPPRILYIGSALPARSETFVYRELLGLREQGVPVWPVSLYQPQRDLGEESLNALASEAVPVYGPGTAALLRDALAESVRRPLRSLRTLGRAILDAAAADDLRMVQRPQVLWQAIAALALARRVRPAAPRHVHAHMANTPTTIAMYLAAQLAITFSFTGHAADLFVHRSMLRPKLQRAAFIACISRWHRTFYQSIVPRADADLPVVRCGVDVPEPQAEAREAPPVPSLLAVGRLVPKKGFDLLLRALAMLRDRGLSIRCTIAGDGPERESLLALRDELDLAGAVDLPGALAHREVCRLMERASLFVLPCRVDASGDRDGIPVVLMEAMARGVCPVSGDLVTIRELIEDGRTGAMVTPGDVAGLADTLERLLADPARRTALGTAAREHIRREFSEEVNLDRLHRKMRRYVQPPCAARHHAGRGRLTRGGDRLARAARYVVISPCRDEATFGRRTLESVVHQSVPPDLWVIVDDGSTDGTDRLLAEYEQRYDFIRVIRLADRGRRSVGPGVIDAFYAGYDSIDPEQFSYVCKLDLDLDLPRDYFERILNRMERDPRLGTCSGKAYFIDADDGRRRGTGRFISERIGDDMSGGMAKFYRMECFREIGGFVREVMWDGIDCHRCRMLGWRACSRDDPALRVLHLRPMGASDRGILRGRMRHGGGQYFMGTGLVYMSGSALFRMTRPPLVIGGLAMWLGYVAAWAAGRPRYEDAEFRRFLRRFQRLALMLGKRRAIGRLERNRA